MMDYTIIFITLSALGDGLYDNIYYFEYSMKMPADEYGFRI